MKPNPTKPSAGKAGGLREKLAKLEHEQWVSWAMDLAKKEKLSEERMFRWYDLIATPYDNLSEKMKEHDREWADKVIKLFASELARQKEELAKESAGKAGWEKDFDNRFSVFDGHQKIIKHVTYSRWIKDFIASELAREKERRVRIEKYIKKELQKLPERIRDSDEKWVDQHLWVDYSTREALKNVLKALTQAAKKVRGK